MLLIERERKLGGILKQCIHDGFGLMTFGERLSGPEYSERFIDKVLASDIEKKLLTFVTKIKKVKDGFVIYYVNREGAGHIRTKAIVLATGCREPDGETGVYPRYKAIRHLYGGNGPVLCESDG